MSSVITGIFSLNILYRIYNKVPISYLERYIPLSDEYLKYRALTLFGVNSLNSPYLTIREKYSQIAAFAGEIGADAHLYIPEFTCLFYALKSKNLELVYKYSNAVDSYIEPIKKLLRTNHALGLELLYNKKRFQYRWDERVSWETYKPLVDAELRNLKMEPDIHSSIVIARKCPINLLRNYKDMLNSCVFGVIGDFYTALEMDIDRYLEMVPLLHLSDKYKIYILDLLEPNSSDIPVFHLLVHFGCINLLKSLISYRINWNIPHNPVNHATGPYSRYPARVPKDRAEATFQFLLKLLESEELSKEQIEQVKTGLNHWSWLLYYKPYDDQGKDIDLDFSSIGNLQLMSGVLPYEDHLYKLDLLNYPEFLDVLEKNIDRYKRIDWSFLINNYSPRLYRIVAKKTHGETFLRFVPDWETLRDILPEMSEKLRFRDSSPLFLEPKRYWESFRK